MNISTKLKTLAGAIFGTVFVLIFMSIMNRPVNYSEGDKAKVTSFNQIENKNDKPDKKEEIKRERPKPKAAPKDIAPDLSSLLAGNNFGIEAFKVDLSNISNSLLGDMTNVAMSEDSVDVAPVATSRAPLEYPATARSKGISGHVNLSLMVNRQGEVEQVKVLESNPTGIFEQAAIAAVKAWHFKPAIYKGEAVSIWVKQRISFNLN